MMKKFTMILALVAILGMAGTTFADVNISVSGPVVTSGYDVYTLSVVAETRGFKDLSIDNVVQVNTFVSGGWVEDPPGTWVEIFDASPTVFNPSYPGGLGAIDTHLLFTTDGATYLGDVSETNDQSLVDPVPDYGYDVGLGSMLMADGIGFSLATRIPAAGDFMQVVLPIGGGETLTGFYSLGAGDVPFEQFVGVVPEPSTILMLVVGGLCFLAVRFRK